MCTEYTCCLPYDVSDCCCGCVYIENDDSCFLLFL